MDKKLLAHEKYMNDAIKKLGAQLKDAEANQKTKYLKTIESLNNYHQIVVRDLQHERLIHLIVTFFFAGILLLTVGASFIPVFTTTVYDYSLMGALILAIISILTVLEIFYIKYYFSLENGVQRLYKLSEKLHELAGINN